MRRVQDLRAEELGVGQLDVGRQEGGVGGTVNVAVLQDQQHHSKKGEYCDRHDDGAYQKSLSGLYCDGLGNVLEEN